MWGGDGTVYVEDDRDGHSPQLQLHCTCAWSLLTALGHSGFTPLSWHLLWQVNIPLGMRKFPFFMMCCCSKHSAHILCTVLLPTLADEVLGSKLTTKWSDLWTPDGVSIWLTRCSSWERPPGELHHHHPSQTKPKPEAGSSSLKQDSLPAGWWLKTDSGFVPRHKTLAACLFMSS